MTDSSRNNYSRSIAISKPGVSSKNGLVTANHRSASVAGARVLARGGNAVDAAVATSFMLGVCEPWMSGVGGCGAMLIYSAKGDSVESIDFGTVSPLSLNPDDYPLRQGDREDRFEPMFNWPKVEQDRNLIGAPSVCVPTTVRGMGVAHERHGTLPWRDLVMPAAHEAARGVLLDSYAGLFIGGAAGELLRFPETAAMFLTDGLPPNVAWTGGRPAARPMPELARVLRRIADRGADEFYSGETAGELIEDVQKAGGKLSLEDMRTYRPIVHAAQPVTRLDHDIYIASELGGGASLVDVFNMLEGSSCNRSGAPGAGDVADLIDALNISFSRRLATMGDSNEARRPSCTSHFNVVDRHGNMVVVTQTLLSVFGSKLLSGQTGILLNNGILWFDPATRSPNSLRPGKRPLNNMCPVIAARRDADLMIGIGAAGGRKILPAVAQILWRMLRFGATLEEAFHAPRFDTSRHNKVVADFRLPDEIVAALKRRYPVELTERHFYPYTFGCPSAVSRQHGINTGCTEVYSLWGDTVTEDCRMSGTDREHE